HLDWRNPDAARVAGDFGDLTVIFHRAGLDWPEVLVAGNRTTLVYQVRPVAGSPDQISGTVPSTAWWLAGVIGSPGPDHDRWDARSATGAVHVSAIPSEGEESHA